MGLALAPRMCEYICGGWKIGSILDTKAVRGSAPTGANVGPRAAPNQSALGINVSISWLSADALRRNYGNPENYTSARFQPTVANERYSAVNQVATTPLKVYVAKAKAEADERLRLVEAKLAQATQEKDTLAVALANADKQPGLLQTALDSAKAAAAAATDASQAASNDAAAAPADVALKKQAQLALEAKNVATEAVPAAEKALAFSRSELDSAKRLVEINRMLIVRLTEDKDERDKFVADRLAALTKMDQESTEENNKYAAAVAAAAAARAA